MARIYSEESRIKRILYTKEWFKRHPAYAKNYAEKHWLKLKIQQRIWRKSNKTRTDYWTREQHREYLRDWRARRKQDKEWGFNYINSLN